MDKRKNLILFTGDSSATLRKNLSAWTEAFVQKYGDSNVAKIRIGETDAAAIVSELLSVPFFAEKRLVVFEGIPRLKTGNSNSGDSDEDSPGENPSDPASAIESAILGIFDSIPDTTLAIFVSETPNRTSVLYKKLIAEGDVKTFEGLHIGNADDYVLGRLPWISRRALTLLIERTAKNPDRKRNDAIEIDDRRLRGAVEKLSLAYGEDSISEKEIDDAEPPVTDQKAYSIGDAILSGDLERAVSTLRAVLEKESAFSAFPAIISTLRKTMQVEFLRRNEVDDSRISEVTGFPSWQYAKRRKFGDTEYQKALAAYSALVKFETDWRTGNAPGEDESSALECGVVSAVLAGKKAR